MPIEYARYSQITHLVRMHAMSHEAWVVGSGAVYLVGEQDERPRDWDILIPFWHWGEASKCIPPGTPANSFGGFKVDQDGLACDMWCGDIGWFLAQVPEGYPKIGVQLKTQVVLRLEKGFK